MKQVLAEAAKLRVDRQRYVEALRDWVKHGPESRFALPPDEVLERSRPRPWEESLAAAHFELGQHLWRLGHAQDAARHFREAHRLQPDNWTYKRQAWVLADPEQGPTSTYDSYWLADVQKIGAENYYPALDMG
jgi:tetratricopeptide (TPR) repeat protein